MSTKPRSQLYQGLALPAKAIMPTTPCKVATPSLVAKLCTFILHYTMGNRRNSDQQSDWHMWLFEL